MNTIVILLVDDDRDDIDIFQQSAKRLKKAVEVRVIQKPEEALAHLHENSLAPHFIVVDMYMPKLNGIDLLKQIKKLDHIAHIPAIMYGDVLPPAPVAGEHEGRLYEEFALKPNSVRDLAVMLDTLIDKYVS